MSTITMYGNEIHLTPHRAQGKRKVLYFLGTDSNGRRLSFPGSRQMKRLARKFLNGELEELKELPRGLRGLYFLLPAGTSAEDRAAFLGAVRHHCKPR